jgi:hypothetical protein
MKDSGELGQWGPYIQASRQLWCIVGSFSTDENYARSKCIWLTMNHELREAGRFKALMQDAYAKKKDT